MLYSVQLFDVAFLLCRRKKALDRIALCFFAMFLHIRILHCQSFTKSIFCCLLGIFWLVACLISYLHILVIVSWCLSKSLVRTIDPAASSLPEQLDWLWRSLETGYLAWAYGSFFLFPFSFTSSSSSSLSFFSLSFCAVHQSCFRRISLLSSSLHFFGPF